MKQSGFFMESNEGIPSFSPVSMGSKCADQVDQLPLFRFIIGDGHQPNINGVKPGSP